MGRYVNAEALRQQWPRLRDLGVPELDSYFIAPAETEVDGLLGAGFTVPFSTDNATVRDMASTLTYVRAGSLKLEDADNLRAQVYALAQKLLDGSAAMVTDSGVSMVAAQPSGLVPTINTPVLSEVFG